MIICSDGTPLSIEIKLHTSVIDQYTHIRDFHIRLPCFLYFGILFLNIPHCKHSTRAFVDVFQLLVGRCSLHTRSSTYLEEGTKPESGHWFRLFLHPLAMLSQLPSESSQQALHHFPCENGGRCQICVDRIRHVFIFKKKNASCKYAVHLDVWVYKDSDIAHFSCNSLMIFFFFQSRMCYVT